MAASAASTAATVRVARWMHTLRLTVDRGPGEEAAGQFTQNPLRVTLAEPPAGQASSLRTGARDRLPRKSREILDNLHVVG
jgi:hypothetical protein